MRLSTDCVGLDSCLSDITSTTVEACVDIVVARFVEPPTGSFVLNASAFKVVRQMVRGYVPCLLFPWFDWQPGSKLAVLIIVAIPSYLAKSTSSPFAFDGVMVHFRRSIDSQRCEERLTKTVINPSFFLYSN